MNRPGILERVHPHSTRTVDGLVLRSVFLVVRFADGRLASVAAALCLPEGEGPHPALIHCPGGSQTIDHKDLVFWARHGFAAASFDWEVGFGASHDPSLKSCWPLGVAAQYRRPDTSDQAILPLAVQAVGGVLDWLAGLPEIAADRVACVGISWGGYLTWLAAAEEPRLKTAVPVYGCGGLFREDRDYPALSGAPWAEEYRRRWDPVARAGDIRCPVLYLGATGDFFGWPRDADGLLDTLKVDHRRSWAPGLDHAILPDQSALAVAWLKRHLSGGPALPAEPRWEGDDLRVDRSAEVDAIEEWYGENEGPDDAVAWFKGKPLPGATVRLARVRYANGIVLTTEVGRRTGSIRNPGGKDAPAKKAIEGAVGWHWCLGGTQFRDNQTEVFELPEGGVRLESEKGDGFLVWRGAPEGETFSGITVDLGPLFAGLRLEARFRARRGAKRIEASVMKSTDARGILDVRAGELGWPEGPDALEVFRVLVSGFTALPIEIRSVCWS